jgi:hypothetical protein
LSKSKQAYAPVPEAVLLLEDALNFRVWHDAKAAAARMKTTEAETLHVMRRLLSRTGVEHTALAAEHFNVIFVEFRIACTHSVTFS